MERNLTVIIGGTLLASMFLALALSTLYFNRGCSTGKRFKRRDVGAVERHETRRIDHVENSS